MTVFLFIGKEYFYLQNPWLFCRTRKDVPRKSVAIQNISHAIFFMWRRREILKACLLCLLGCLPIDVKLLTKVFQSVWLRINCSFCLSYFCFGGIAKKSVPYQNIMYYIDKWKKLLMSARGSLLITKYLISWEKNLLVIDITIRFIWPRMKNIINFETL